MRIDRAGPGPGAGEAPDRPRRVRQWDFVLAAVICTLLMAALFENFLKPP